ncbi:MAG: NUDIX hydrolase [Candidatus Aenigmatarchaeota archaeon]
MIHDTATLVIENDGKFLLIQRSHPPNIGRWESPGGHVDEGETSEQAAIREGQEELGGVEIIKELGVLKHTVEEDHHHMCHVFLCKLKGDLVLSAEAADHGWFTKEEIKKKNNVAAFFLRILDEYLD